MSRRLEVHDPGGPDLTGLVRGVQVHGQTQAVVFETAQVAESGIGTPVVFPGAFADLAIVSDQADREIAVRNPLTGQDKVRDAVLAVLVAVVTAPGDFSDLERETHVDVHGAEAFAVIGHQATEAETEAHSLEHRTSGEADLAVRGGPGVHLPVVAVLAGTEERIGRRVEFQAGVGDCAGGGHGGDEHEAGEHGNDQTFHFSSYESMYTYIALNGLRIRRFQHEIPYIIAYI